MRNITADKSSSLLLIFTENLNSIKTALGFHKAHSRASHGTMVKLIHPDLSFHSHTWRYILTNLLQISNNIYSACFQKEAAEMLKWD